MQHNYILHRTLAKSFIISLNWIVSFMIDVLTGQTQLKSCLIGFNW
jgi:hypothetical protein